MKKIILIVLLMFSINKFYAQELSMEFTTIPLTGMKYSPSHILAVWITNNSGVYQKTLLVYADMRIGYLTNWNSQTGGDKVDAITGPTRHSHTTRTVSWDMKNIFNVEVPDGDYNINIEMTSDDFSGPFKMISFTKGSENFTLSPSDNDFLKDITITYNSGVAASNSIDVEKEYLTIYPNPANKTMAQMDVKLLKDSPSTIQILDLAGKTIDTEKINLKKGANKINLHNIVSKLKAGTYMVQVETNHYNIAKPLILKK